MYQYIKDIKTDADIEFVIHSGKQHGLDDEDAFNRIVQTNCKLLICPDSATADEEEHKKLLDLNIRTLVLDHHPTDVYSKYAVVINNQLSPNVKNKDFCGVGVVYKFIKYCDLQYNTNYADNYIDLVALGSIADVMDTRQLETRYYIMNGLKNIKNELFKQILLATLKTTDNITMKDISFNVANRINAIIRSGTLEDKIDLFYAFISPNKKVLWTKGVRSKEQEYTVVEKIILLADKLKKQQADEVKQIISEDSEINNTLPFTMVKTFEKSNYNGLIAMKLCSETNKPTLVGRNNGGSFRGLESHGNIKELLSTCEYINLNEGHNSAGGYGIKDGEWDNFVEWIKIQNIQNIQEVVKSYNYDEIPPQLFQDSYQNKHLWGSGIKSPLFHIKPFTINSSDIMMVGNNTTLKIPMGNLTAIKFFCSRKIRDEFYEGQGKDIEVELIVELDINYWNDYSSNQLLIQQYSVKLAEPKPTWDDLF